MKNWFEQGVIGQQQLAAALADDFDGLTHEQLRQRSINGAPALQRRYSVDTFAGARLSDLIRWFEAIS